MSKPVLAAGLLAVMAGAWYWALAPTVPRAPTSVPSAGTSRRSEGSVPAVRLDQLAAGLADRPVPDGGRDPFRARAIAVDARRTTPAPGDPRPVAPPGPPAATWPRLDLIGIAEAREAGVLVRTAIVSAPQGVLHARPGETLSGVYRLERIGIDGVEVRLLPEDRVVRLALRP